LQKKRLALLALVAAALTLLAANAGTAAQPSKHKPPKHQKAKAKGHVKTKPATAMNATQKLAHVKHLVVIYEENHSFDNLYGGWEGVNGRTSADQAHTVQVNQAGTPYTCLMQNDVNLAALPATCTDSTTGTTFTSHFTNAPFLIDDYLKPTDTTCPPNPNAAFTSANGFLKGTGSPGGCTRDLVHEFYQEQYQLNGGAQNRYTTGSDAVGLTQGMYDTKQLPIYAYLHAPSHPKYVILDNFFQAAFGGSFLNHQWLIAAASPVCVSTATTDCSTLHTLLDTNGMPTSYPLYTKTNPAAKRNPLAVTCPSPVPNRACGDFAVNTMQPSQQPSGTFGAKLSLQTHRTIGDNLSAANVDWAWYAGGWSNAAGNVNAPGWTNGPGPTCSDPNVIPGSTYPNCPDGLFQFHHQPFSYFAAYGPNTAARAAHLKDEVEFMSTVQGSGTTCGLKPVSFVKPIGENNEHPGYASTPGGESHLVTLLKAIEGSACAKDTMVVVTYDEFGGQWDHVPPPGQAGGPAGPHDLFGPGTRIPALVLSPYLTASAGLDHTEYDTTAILRTIEQRWKLPALSDRDAAEHSLANVFNARPLPKK
jgi:acid phosphatase